jgi:lysozyme family protein
MKTIDDVITGVILREGREYTNRPSDKGGPTKFGIIQATLSKYRGRAVTAAEVAALTEDEARAIYRSLFVLEPNFNLILDINVEVGVELVDTGANMGTLVAAKFLQRTLNAFNGRGTYYADLKVDGHVGTATAKALAAFIKKRAAPGIDVMMKSLNHLQGARYIELAEAREENEDYVYGWIRERA